MALKLDNRIIGLKKDIKQLANQPNININTDTRLNKVLLHNELDYLEKKQ